MPALDENSTQQCDILDIYSTFLLMKSPGIVNNVGYCCYVSLYFWGSKYVVTKFRKRIFLKIILKKKHNNDNDDKDKDKDKDNNDNNNNKNKKSTRSQQDPRQV